MSIQYKFENKTYTDFHSLAEAFGRDMLEKLRAGDDSDRAFWREILEKKLLSLHMDNAGIGNEKTKRLFDMFEGRESLVMGKQLDYQLYGLAFLLTKERTFVLNGNSFDTIDDFARYMRAILNSSVAEFASVCKTIYRADGSIEPQFRAWVLCHGKNKVLNEWAENLKKAQLE